MRKNLFYIIALLLLVIVAIQVVVWYFGNHEYYFTMASIGSNRAWVIWWLLIALLPYYYLFVKKDTRFKQWVLAVFFWLYLFLFGYLAFSWALPGWWFLKLFINTLVMSVLMWWFIYLITHFWNALNSYCFPKKLQIDSWKVVLLEFWLWLFTFLVVVYACVLLGVLSPWISWVIVALLAYIAYTNHETNTNHFLPALQSVKTWRNETLDNAKQTWLLWKIWKILLIITGIVWLWYLFYGYLLSYMPYSTAWDANHAYMFYPKMRALNHWVYWFEASMNSLPRFWDMFITFWFSVSQPLKWRSGISPDTIALVTNFFSGVFVLLLWIGVVRVLVEYLTNALDKATKKIVNVPFLMGLWSILWISWLTSGMWAFLVFVDNKTDLWMLTFLLLWLLAWLYALGVYRNWSDTKTVSTSWWFRPIVLSWIFFAWWVLSKPTALFDLITFTVFTRWTLIWLVSALWIVSIVIWILVYLQIKGMGTYMPQSRAKYFIWLWGIGIITSIKKFFWWKNIWKHITFMLIWVCAVIIPLVVIKWAFVIPDALINENRQIQDVPKRILFAQNTENPWNTENMPTDQDSLPSTASTVPSPSVCSLSSEWLNDTQDLYTGLKEIKPWRWFNEDVQRYVWYWWKWWSADNEKPYMGWVAEFLPYGCFWYEPAKTLCTYRDAINSLDTQWLTQLLDELPADSWQYENIQTILAWIPGNENPTMRDLQQNFATELRDLRNYYEDRTVLVAEEWINTDEWVKYINALFVPYKFLNFLNMTYNRSLKNSASYYTDIGFHRLILLLVIVFAWVYAIAYRKKHLWVVALSAWVSWILWHLVAWWIIWYNLWVITWSILVAVAFWFYASNDYTTFRNNNSSKILTYSISTILVILVGLILLQTVANMVRIVSHSARIGPVFLWYKSNQIVETTFDDSLQRSQKAVRYDQEATFNNQFPHYKKFIDQANNRNPGEWIWIAWTYLRYFVENQNNVKYDQLIQWIWPNFTDNNVCRTALRFDDLWLNYMLLDLNIWTVVQGEWNRSLYYRFFGEVNPLSWAIETDGAITMMTKLVENWYYRLFSTNNIWTKYAWTLPSESFWELSGDELTLFRARMAVARYAWSPQNNSFLDSIIDVANQRVDTWVFMDDLADIYGLEIRTNAMLDAVRTGLTAEFIASLTQDERQILDLFMGLRQMKEQNPQQFAWNMRNIITNSVFSSNQIAVIQRVK